jgi:hypothetical protein
MPMVQNKANFALCPMGRGLATKAVAGNRAKQSQTWAGWEIWGTAYQGRMLCQTNPIRPGSGRHRGRNVSNKPNSGPAKWNKPRGARSGGCRAKQSQFPERRASSSLAWLEGACSCETNPIRPGTQAGRDLSRQTNPIRPGVANMRNKPNRPRPGPHWRRNVPNKPNPAPGASVVGVKQSQFREGWIDVQVPCRKGIMTVLTHRWPQENKANSQAGSQSRVCQTKPIPGAGLSPASGRLLLGRDEYNGWESFFRFSRAHFGRVGTPIYER